MTMVITNMIILVFNMMNINHKKVGVDKMSLNNQDKKKKILEEYRYKWSLILFIISFLSSFISIPFIYKKCPHSAEFLCGDEYGFGVFLKKYILVIIIIYIILTIIYFLIHIKQLFEAYNEDIEELERRKIIEEKYVKKQNESKIIKEEKTNNEFENWVDSVKKNINCYKDKEYITFSIDNEKYDYTKFYFWYENDMYYLYCPLTTKKVYEDKIFANGGLICEKSITLNKFMGKNSYTSNPKKSATIKGALIGGVAGAMIGASSTDETKKEVFYDTGMIYTLTFGDLKAYINKKDYEMISTIVDYNKNN